MWLNLLLQVALVTGLCTLPALCKFTIQSVHRHSLLPQGFIQLLLCSGAGGENDENMA
jgi:hypothetical protein